MKAFVTRELPKEALDIVRSVADTEVWPELAPPPYDLLLEKVADIDGLLCLLTDRIDETLLSHAPKLKVVSQMAVGYDNIDVAACARRGIPVGHTPGVLTETTADLTFALLLATARRIVEADRYTRSGEWQTWHPMLLTGPDVHHATLGIIGMGRIGYEVAKRACGFEMVILYTDVQRNAAAERDFGARYVDMDTLLTESDFVTVHTPLSPETRHLIGAAQLAKMKPTAIFINTSRGPVVDQKALYEALKYKHIAAAGLDVYEVEPLPLDDPLLTLDNAVLLPHIGSASVATRTKMAILAAENLVAGLQGKPLPHPVPV
jgi:glyoxylate reductase